MSRRSECDRAGLLGERPDTDGARCARCTPRAGGCARRGRGEQPQGARLRSPVLHAQGRAVGHLVRLLSHQRAAHTLPARQRHDRGGARIGAGLWTAGALPALRRSPRTERRRRACAGRRAVEAAPQRGRTVRRAAQAAPPVAAPARGGRDVAQWCSVARRVHRHRAPRALHRRGPVAGDGTGRWSGGNTDSRIATR